MTTTSEFYAAEITLFRGFTDPLGPADLGWMAQPWGALSEIEAVPTTTSLLYVSDQGYRTLASDPGGVIAYPPRLSGPFTVDVSANLDPVQSSIAAAWGALVLSNTDSLYDSAIAAWTTDGQSVTIYRGYKTLDSRGIFVDPAKSTLKTVFHGVMAPMVPGHGIVTIALRDASYFLQDQIRRITYDGTGGLDGTADMTGISQPVLIGGDAFTLQVLNITPNAVDPANLIYQYAANQDLAPYPVSAGGVVIAAYDGGAVLTMDAGVADVYAAAPAAGHCTFDSTRGVLRLGSAPVFQLTVDAYQFRGGGAGSNLDETLWRALAQQTTLPAADYVHSVGFVDVLGVDATARSQVIHFPAGCYVAAGEDITGVDFINQLIAGSGAYLVPSKDGYLRLFCLSPIPAGFTSAITFDDTTIVQIEPVDLPAAVNPPPLSMSLGYGRNWTVQTSLAGAITAARRAFVAQPIRRAVAVAMPSMLAVPQHQTALGVVAATGSLANALSISQPIINNMVAFWGVKRRLYEITVPTAVLTAANLTMEWGTVAFIKSDFDGLEAGKQGQCVGWRYSNEDPTATFRMIV